MKLRDFLSAWPVWLALAIGLVLMQGGDWIFGFGRVLP